jgi:acyl-coenzyme A synthetase/AMP-(fatty) acid ligase
VKRKKWTLFKKAKKKIGSIGKSIPGGKIFLRRKNYKSGIGELYYKGKNIFMGYSKSYLDLKKKNKKSLVLKTGDLATMDSQGYFYIVGRKDKIVKVAGNRINLEELSNIIKAKGIECELLYDNNKIKIFVRKNYENIRILDILYANTSINKNFFKLIVINKFPLNIRGKIDLLKLKNYG